MKGHSKAEYYLEPKIALSGRLVPKSVQKCDRTSHAQKRAARTHISYTFQNGFRTHTHTCAHLQFEVVALRTRIRTRTFCKSTFFSKDFQQIFNIL